MVAYGALLPQSALDIPPHGWVNLHFSVLPRWRGAAPVQHAIWAGDEVTGATTFRIVKELDAGPTFGVMTERIRPDDTSGDLLERLAEGGAGLLVATLDGDRGRRRSRRASSRPRASRFAPKIMVEDARGRLGRAGGRGRPAGPCLHARARRLDDVRRRAGQARPGHAHRRPSRLDPGVLEVRKPEVLVGTGTHAGAPRRREAPRQEGDARRRLGARLKKLTASACEALSSPAPPRSPLPALDAVVGLRPRAGRRGHPPRRAGRPRPQAARQPGRRCGPRSSAYPCSSPTHPRDPEFQQQLRDLEPDCCPVVAYGALLPQSALDIPPHGWVNLHFSCLPAWRGAAPVQHAIWAGDEVTGATTFRIVKELDAGPDLRRDDRTDPPDRHRRRPARAAGRGRRRACSSPPSTASPRAPSTRAPSRRTAVSFAPKIEVADAEIDWSEPAVAVDRQDPRVHARRPVPGRPTRGADQDRPGRPRSATRARSCPGDLAIGKQAVLRRHRHDPVRLGDVKAFGKRQMAAADWARGLRTRRAGARLR